MYTHRAKRHAYEAPIKMCTYTVFTSETSISYAKLRAREPQTSSRIYHIEWDSFDGNYNESLMAIGIAYVCIV